MTSEGAKPVLRRTADYQAMRRLALKSGLEDGSFEGYEAAFGYFVDDDLVGCAALKMKDLLFTVECLAVDEGFRGKGIGRSLITMIEEEAAAKGADRIWALARAPEFFIKNGYHLADPDSPGGPSMKGCEACPQFKRNCNPAVVHKTL